MPPTNHGQRRHEECVTSRHLPGMHRARMLELLLSAWERARAAGAAAAMIHPKERGGEGRHGTSGALRGGAGGAGGGLPSSPFPKVSRLPPPPPGSIFSGTSGTDVGVIDLVQGRPKGVITLVRNHRYRGIVTSRYQLEPVFCRHIWVCHSCCSCRVCVCEWRCVCMYMYMYLRAFVPYVCD